MRAVTVSTPGDADQLQVVERDAPTAGGDEVVIDVAAAGVNRADLLQRQGRYNPPAGMGDVLGLECAGVISAVGQTVRDWHVGDRVCALLTAGGYAEQVAVPAGQVLPVPEPLTMVEAAGLVETACTVWSNVFMDGALQPGETFLVHGGSSGIGTTAIQIAHARGSRVATTAGTTEKLDVCRSLGADLTINYRDEDFVEVVSDDGGADVILDNMGAKYLPRNVQALRTGGRLMIIGMQGGVKGELNIGTLLAKRAAVHATSLRARPTEEKAAIVSEVIEHVWPLVPDGRLRPLIHQTFDLAQVADAHRVLEASTHIGKVILTTGEEA